MGIFISAHEPVESILRKVATQVPPAELAAVLREQWGRSREQLLALRAAGERNPAKIYDNVMSPIVNWVLNTAGDEGLMGNCKP